VRLRSPYLSQWVNDVAHQLVVIHALLELRLDIIAGSRLHSLKVRIYRRIHAALDQMASVDQLGYLRALQHGGEDAAEASTIAAAWRGSQPEDDGVGIPFDHRPIRPGASVVSFVNDD
jgi:hypothetical protein